MDGSMKFFFLFLACCLQFSHFGLSQTTTKSRRDLLIEHGSGAGGVPAGGVTFEDDEDLADFSSGSGSGQHSGSGSGYYIHDHIKIEVEVRLINEKFHQDLNDSRSEMFKALASWFEQKLYDLFSNLPGEIQVRVHGFSPGSVRVHFEVIELDSPSGTYSDGEMPAPVKLLDEELKTGSFAGYNVSSDDLVYHTEEVVVERPRLTQRPMLAPTTKAPRKVYPATSSPTRTNQPKTDCQRTSEHSKRLSESNPNHYVPKCTERGEYAGLQCQGLVGMGDCWCVDLDGKEVIGTSMEAPNYPDCTGGINLPPCTFDLLLIARSPLLELGRPECMDNGEYKPVQCQERFCFCVNEDGKKIQGTEVYNPNRPQCGREEEKEEEEFGNVNRYIPPVEEKEDSRESEGKKDNKNTGFGFPIDEEGKETVLVEGGESTVIDEIDPDDINVNIELGGPDEDKDDKDDDDDRKNNNNAGVDDEIIKQVPAESRILTQPGLLGGIIGGAVVVLLGLVLLIMFIVYRMRKKDEGSYPLDEPRKTPKYPYVRAPEREYYA